ncbi:hypothetical protein [Cronobacter turicensis]|uniref:hypothetical protein n=1 Tax=Cronobacter turicensis TaxID=413502 RepID=UPI001FD0C8B2|nr:hypothetical protein [Cronobacter turicensis]
MALGKLPMVASFALNYIDILYSFAKKNEVLPASGKTFNLKIDTTYYFEKFIVEGVVDEPGFHGTITFSLVYM